MKEWFSSYGYLLIVLVVVLAVFIVLLNMAAKAYSKHMSRYKAEEAEIKRLTALKEKFKDFDEESLLKADKSEILEGVALTYQLYLQKKDNMEDEFLKFNEAQQYIYVLDVFVQDASVKTFFSENTDILRSRIVPAMKLIGLEEESEKIERIRRMYDNFDEEVSYSEKEMEETDKYLKDGDILRRIKLFAAEYILNNISLLKNYK